MGFRMTRRGPPQKAPAWAIKAAAASSMTTLQACWRVLGLLSNRSSTPAEALPIYCAERPADGEARQSPRRRHYRRRDIAGFVFWRFRLGSPPVTMSD